VTAANEVVTPPTVVSRSSAISAPSPAVPIDDGVVRIPVNSAAQGLPADSLASIRRPKGLLVVVLIASCLVATLGIVTVGLMVRSRFARQDHGPRTLPTALDTDPSVDGPKEPADPFEGKWVLMKSETGDASLDEVTSKNRGRHPTRYVIGRQNGRYYFQTLGHLRGSDQQFLRRNGDKLIHGSTSTSFTEYQIVNGQLVATYFAGRGGGSCGRMVFTRESEARQQDGAKPMSGSAGTQAATADVPIGRWKTDPIRNTDLSEDGRIGEVSIRAELIIENGAFELRIWQSLSPFLPAGMAQGGLRGATGDTRSNENEDPSMGKEPKYVWEGKAVADGSTIRLKIESISGVVVEGNPMITARDKEPMILTILKFGRLENEEGIVFYPTRLQ
jgi:hypothetical protein